MSSQNLELRIAIWSIFDSWSWRGDNQPCNPHEESAWLAIYRSGRFLVGRWAEVQYLNDP
jgi:hypothetical protein